MGFRELKRIGQDFFFNGLNMTEKYYSGTHQIVLGGDCIDLALDAVENIDGIDLLLYDDEVYCYLVAPGLSEEEFFDRVVSLVESAVAEVSEDDGTYSVRRKIPSTPELPKMSEVSREKIGNAFYYVSTVHLGRGYGKRYSQVDILMSVVGRKILYRVTRFNNDITGPEQDGEAKIFEGVGAQWQAVCFAYGIKPSEGETKEAAQRAKKFVFAVVGELMDRFWSRSGVQPSYMSLWQSAQSTAPTLATV